MQKFGTPDLSFYLKIFPGTSPCEDRRRLMPALFQPASLAAKASKSQILKDHRFRFGDGGGGAWILLDRTAFEMAFRNVVNL